MKYLKSVMLQNIYNGLKQSQWKGKAEYRYKLNMFISTNINFIIYHMIWVDKYIYALCKFTNLSCVLHFHCFYFKTLNLAYITNCCFISLTLNFNMSSLLNFSFGS